MEQTPGKRLKLLRAALGFPDRQNEFAEALGISQQALSNMERDKGKPSFDSLQRIIEVFPTVNSEWLLLGTGSMLRGSKELTPISEAPARPAPIKTEQGQVDFVQRYIANLEQQLSEAAQREADAAEREAWLREMLKKPLGNRTAATEFEGIYTERAPIGFATATAKAPETECVMRSMYTSLDTVPVTPTYAYN